MNIPRFFFLHGQKVEIEFDDKLTAIEDLQGKADYRQNKIILQPLDKYYPNQIQLEHIFLHELVHQILFHMEQHKLRDDDNFINLFSNLLHQALTTMGY